jgi:CheY-like chemotaxis protein
LSEIQRDYLDKTETAAKNLLGIINDILDFSKIEAGKLLMERIDFRLEEVLDGVISLFTFKAGDKGLELVLSVDPGVRTALVGDPVRLSQVLNNLMGNAMKFTSEGGVELVVERVDEPAAGAQRLRFLVKDTGIGLSQEQIDNLFTAFNQADSSFTRRYGGTGLGLAISKRMVEMMDGKIWVEGELGKGSTFGFTALFGLGESPAVYLSPQESLKGVRALAADDYPAALSAMARNLENLGLEATSAGSGGEALALMRSAAEAGKPFKLAVVDRLSGELDAPALALAVKEMDEGERPTLILTAMEGDPVVGSAQELGFQAVVYKPVTPAGLMVALGEALRVSTPVKGRRRRAAPAGEAASVAHLKGSRILLAEDNEVNQLVACRLLKNAGLAVDVANNGREAVDMVQAKSYDLVLMDIQMPVMDGLAATKAIRSLPGQMELPIVAMTAHAMSGDREQSLAVGMNDHITKPINLAELFGALNRWIAKIDGAAGPSAG